MSEKSVCFLVDIMPFLSDYDPIITDLGTVKRISKQGFQVGLIILKPTF